MERKELIEHTPVTVLYQAYEACLKNWYTQRFNPEVEKKIRLDLMNALLVENKWEPADIEKNITAPHVRMDRDAQGWMKTSTPLLFSEGTEILRSIKGMEINDKTGAVDFFLDQWQSNRPLSEKAFTLFDFQQMLEKAIEGGLFSLDQADPHQSYHPFQLMWFKPSRLYESEFLNTMLLTDLILKFLTIDQEVHSTPPYDRQPIERFIQHLPDNLKNIIKDFHKSPQSGAIHRFWIEAEALDVTSEIGEEVARYEVGNIRMIVKKHRMEMDVDGKLKDVDNEKEGWPLYMLSTAQIKECEKGQRQIESDAMIFVSDLKEIRFWENGSSSITHVSEAVEKAFALLKKQPCDENGKIISNAENISLLYRITKEITAQALKAPKEEAGEEEVSAISHRYTPEFVFAEEFTRHYDEFALYFPEFGRLKQLAKVTSLIKILNSIHKANQVDMQAIEALKGNDQRQFPLTERQFDANERQQKMYYRVRDAVMEKFHSLRHQFGRPALHNKWELRLVEMGKQSKIDIVAQKKIGFNIKTYSIAQMLSNQEQAQFKAELRKIFFPDMFYVDENAISTFMQDNVRPLAETLAWREGSEAKAMIQKAYPNADVDDISVLMWSEGNEHFLNKAIENIANKEALYQLNKQKEAKEIVEAGFAKIGLGKHAEPEDLTGKCFWVPSCVRHTESESRRSLFFVYGGVDIQPKLNIVQGKVNLVDRSIKRYQAADLEQAKRRFLAQQAVVNSSGGITRRFNSSGSHSHSSGNPPPGPPGSPPRSPRSNPRNIGNKIKHSVLLELQQANILDVNERLSEQTIKASLRIKKGKELRNPEVIRELTKNGRPIDEWDKVTTPSIQLSTGQKIQVHFYKNRVTNEVNYNIDYKVKGYVHALYSSQKAAAEDEKIAEKIGRWCSIM